MKSETTQAASRCREQRIVGQPCGDCAGTGWYGDNGPGIVGNSEFCRCECGTVEKCRCGYHHYIEIGNVPWCEKCNREADMDICRIHVFPNASNDASASSPIASTGLVGWPPSVTPAMLDEAGEQEYWHDYLHTQDGTYVSVKEVETRLNELAACLRNVLPVFDNEGTRVYAEVYAKEIKKAEEVLASLPNTH